MLTLTCRKRARQKTSEKATLCKEGRGWGRAVANATRPDPWGLGGDQSHHAQAPRNG